MEKQNSVEDGSGRMVDFVHYCLLLLLLQKQKVEEDRLEHQLDDQLTMDEERSLLVGRMDDSRMLLQWERRESMTRKMNVQKMDEGKEKSFRYLKCLSDGMRNDYLFRLRMVSLLIR